VTCCTFAPGARRERLAAPFRRIPSMLRSLSFCAALVLGLVAAPPAHSLVAVQAKIDARAPAALAAAEAYAKSNPGSAPAQVALARARMQAGQAEKAIAAAEKATKLAPNDAQAFRWLGSAYGMRIGQVGMFGKMSLAPKLRAAFERAVQLDPALLEARFALVEFYMLAPGAIGGGIDKAQAQAREIGKRDPGQGQLAQASIALHQERAGDAVKHFAAALAARPADPKVRLAVAAGYQRLERWDDAFRLLRAWIAEPAAPAAAWYQLGRAAAVSGRSLDDGVAALEKFMQMARGPDDPEPKHALYRLGQIHAKAGRKPQARAALDRALALDPKYDDAKAERAKL
jgi:tetratricopeptide (TPR) repeat protein